jgi:hypothetical protein
MSLMSTSKFAKACGVHPETVRRWAREGKLSPAGTTPGGHHRWSPEQIPGNEPKKLADDDAALAWQADIALERARLRARR